MSIKAGKLVAPALKYFGGNLGNGSGRFSDKVIKIPSRRGPDALRYILNDFEANAEIILDYYVTRRKVFLRILKTISRHNKFSRC
jgi:sulfite reductase (ferredoxin)